MVRPLAYASLKLQRDENSMADIVVCYLDIFEGFSKRRYGSNNLVAEVEKRWYQCEQPLMLLALFLHRAHRQASKKLLDKTALTTIGSLCRVGVYYFKRFSIDQNVAGLYEDLARWIKGDEDALLPFSAFRSIDAYWTSMVTDMPGSKLPRLAIIILGFAVNTANCERYFSELALIHTAKRNNLSPEKARKLALVRKRVRENDRARNTSISTKRRRLIDPAERTLLRDRDDRFESSEPDVDHHPDDENVEGSDRALEYWSSVLCELEPDNDPQSLQSESENTHTTATLGNAAKRFALKVNEIKEQSVEPIPEPDRRPFPNYNDMRFPQEKALTGLRGQKVSLAELSGVSSPSSVEPGKAVQIAQLT